MVVKPVSSFNLMLFSTPSSSDSHGLAELFGACGFVILLLLLPGCGPEKRAPEDRTDAGLQPVVRYFSDPSGLDGPAGLSSLGVLDYDLFNVDSEHLIKDSFENLDRWTTMTPKARVVEEGALEIIRDAACADGTALELKQGMPYKARLFPADGNSFLFSCLRIKLPEGADVENYKDLVFFMGTTLAPWNDLSDLNSDHYLGLHSEWKHADTKNRDGWMELYQVFMPAETARSMVVVLNPDCKGLEDPRPVFIDEIVVRVATPAEIASSFIDGLPDGVSSRVVPIPEFSMNGEVRDALATAAPGELRLPLPPGGRRVLRFGLCFPSAGSEGHCRNVGIEVALAGGDVSSDGGAGDDYRVLHQETVSVEELRDSSLNWLERTVTVPPVTSPSHLVLRSANADPAGATERNAIVMWGSPELVRPPEAGEEKPLNVVLVSIDTLRYDRLGVYGAFHPAGVSPFIDNLARRSLVFDDAVAQAPFTLPSHVSMLSGQYPCVHRVERLGNRINTQRTPMMAEVLGHAGYVTGAFTAGVLVDHVFGFNKGFDTYMETEPCREGRIECPLKWLDANKDLPFFLFFHTFAVHCFGYNDADYIDRFDPGCTCRIHHFTNTPDWLDWIAHPESHTEEEVACVQNKYMAGVRMADDAVKTVIEHLDELGVRDRTLIVITSDHGQELLERGVIDHGNSLYEEQVHVPLIIQPPGGMAPRRIPDVVESIDIAPTIFDFLKIPQPISIQGRSLRPFFDPASAHKADGLAFSEVILRVQSYALRANDWKVIYNPDPEKAAPKPYSEYELFNLHDDPSEVNNRKALPAMKDFIKRIDAMRDNLEKTSDAIQGQMVEGQEIDPGLFEELRQQGYIR